MNDEAVKPLTPIRMLAVALAYMIDVDRHRPAEEKAELIVVFGKMVTRGEINEAGLAELVQFAFDYIDVNPVEGFLNTLSASLTPLQKIAVYINVLDVMLADGRLVEAEHGLLRKMQEALSVDHDTMLAIREVLFVKNDTRMFLHPEHPRNAPDSFLNVTYTGGRTE